MDEIYQELVDKAEESYARFTAAFVIGFASKWAANVLHRSFFGEEPQKYTFRSSVGATAVTDLAAYLGAGVESPEHISEYSKHFKVLYDDPESFSGFFSGIYTAHRAEEYSHRFFSSLVDYSDRGILEKFEEEPIEELF